MHKNFEYIRVAVAVPKLKVANPYYNVCEIKELVKKTYEEKNASVILLPELSLTGYTCGDLFNQNTLIKAAQLALENLVNATKDLNILTVLGMPIRADNQLFNCAVAIKSGRVLAAIPKTYLPNYNEFYEKRWFASSTNRKSDIVRLCEQDVPFNENILLIDKLSNLVVGIEICEDLWATIPPSSYHTRNGANLILNLSASNDTVEKISYVNDLVKLQSSKAHCAYAYASAGEDESTTDVVFSGHCVISENGKLLNENRYGTKGSIIYSDIDIELLNNDRIKYNSFMEKSDNEKYQNVFFELGYIENLELQRNVDSMPFIPKSSNALDDLKDIVMMQSTALLQRMKKIGAKKAILGVSGGLDSTLALLVAVEAFKKLGEAPSNIIAITMPGFGTSDRTYNNATTIMKNFGVTVREISIKDAVLQHFKDIGHDENNHDVTYENSQARERTQILMDIANMENGLVIGTGDLSELALGWCTYNGDHMSMYGVNAGIPKTLIRNLVRWYANENTTGEVKDALLDICDTPVSPELLPPSKDGEILQLTEKSVGSYDLNDFFLYNMLKNGYGPDKIFYLAKIAFKDSYKTAEILETLKKFYKRFFTQQFKRSCMPDGTKVGPVSLSPRGDWKMPSDASYELWLSILDKIEIN